MIALILAFACVAANAYFVAAEFAFAKVRPTALDAMARKGDPRAARALGMTRRLDAYLSATQLGITLASLGLGWLGEPALADLVAPPLKALGAPEGVVHGVAYTLAFAGISLLHIVVGELVPKSIALQYPETVSRLSSRSLRYFFLLTWPAMWILIGLSNLILRALRMPPVEHGSGKLSADEIRLIIQASFGGADSHDRKRDLLERVLRGTDRPVRVVMVPRVDMVIVTPDDDIEFCIELVRKHGYSRYPLCEDGDPDRVIGYLHVKDILTAKGEGRNLMSMKREVLFVPESRRVGELLSEFQLTSTPIGIVVDEYGGTDGMVTVEDVVEEMVGEIQDEHDTEHPRLVARGDGTIYVDGALPVDELVAEGLVLPVHEDAETVGGLVVAALGRLARPRDRVSAGAWYLLVEGVRRRRVTKLLLIPRDGPESEPPAD